MSGATSTSTWCLRQGRTERRSGRTSTRGSVLLMDQGYLPPSQAPALRPLSAGAAAPIAASDVVAGGDAADARRPVGRLTGAARSDASAAESRLAHPPSRARAPAPPRARASPPR